MASTGAAKSRALAPLLLGFATSALANGVPYYVIATPTPTAAVLPALQARQTSSPTSSAGEEGVGPLVESCSSALESFLAIIPQAPESLADWLVENASGSCSIYSTTDIPASLTSELSSLVSQGSSVNCHDSSLVEIVMSTCAELPQFSASINPMPEECQDSNPCGDSEDGKDDSENGGEEENVEEDDKGNDDSESVASHLMDLRAAGALALVIFHALL